MMDRLIFSSIQPIHWALTLVQSKFEADEKEKRSSKRLEQLQAANKDLEDQLRKTQEEARSASICLWQNFELKIGVESFKLLEKQT